MASCLMKGKEVDKVNENINWHNEKLMQDILLPIKSFRKIKGDSYKYFVMADRVLSGE